MSTPLSLLDVLAQVPDPRSRHGRRHPLTAILGLAVLAMLSGAKSYQAIAPIRPRQGVRLGACPRLSAGQDAYQINFLSSLPRFGRAGLRARPGSLDRRTAARGHGAN